MHYAKEIALHFQITNNLVNNLFFVFPHSNMPWLHHEILGSYYFASTFPLVQGTQTILGYLHFDSSN
jgi:hypothetical protein